ncbi:flavodoxin domain-containing protein [Peribacillus simplex]|uniref:flavodoxin domain-containing protein n=1 Tax=Peribacillus simplex TaxID=1478 RepID=UPI0034E8FA19
MKVFIGYVSLSGNTEKMAINIKNRMKAVGCEVYMERLDTVEVDALKDFDLAFIGLYTWNLEDLPYEAHGTRWTLLEGRSHSLVPAT